MVIVKLQGGLGNQMFQYAAAKSITGQSPVYFDTEFLNSQAEKTPVFTPRKLELSIFKPIKIRVPNKFILRAIKGDTITGRLLKKIALNNTALVYQSEKNEWIQLDNLTSSTVYLDGYFQNENYFKTIRQQLLHDFQFPALIGYSKEIEGSIMAATNSVSVHVRRGDYLKPEVNAYHGVLPVAYYQQAKSKIETQITSPNYFVFSDDPEWCKTNICFSDNMTIVSSPLSNSWEDMYLMSLCNNHILANSSYSWWGAWLNNNPTKMVIAPKQWFASTIADIVPENWIKI